MIHNILLYLLMFLISELPFMEMHIFNIVFLDHWRRLYHEISFIWRVHHVELLSTFVFMNTKH